MGRKSREKAERRAAKQRIEKLLRPSSRTGTLFRFIPLATGHRHPAWTPSTGEGIHYSYDDLGHHFVFILSDLDAEEVKGFQTGPWGFGLVETPAALLLLSKWSGGYFDAPYCWHAVPSECRVLPEPPEPGKAPGFFLYLVTHETGIIQAIRMIAPGYEFGVALEDAIRRQAARSISQLEHKVAVDALYSQFSDPRLMFDRAMVTWHTPGW